MPDDPCLVDQLVEAVDRFGSTLDAAAIDRGGPIGPGLRGRLAELGLFGLSIPTGYGGLGLSLAGTTAVCAALARHDRSVATTVGLHAGLGSRPLVSRGEQGLRDRLLPDLATGDKIASFATTESEAGSDLTAIRTRVVPAAEGGVRLTGSKIYVTNGGFAGVFTVAAALPAPSGGRGGHALFVVERSDPGVTIGAEEHKLGLRGSSTVTVHFDGVHLPADRRITGGPGMEGVADALAYGRTVLSAGCVGTARAALDAIVRHVRVRQQFGRPLLASPIVQSQVSRAAAQVFSMDALVRAAAREASTLETDSIAAKIACSEGAWSVTDLAVQLHGGSGYIEDTGVALLLRDARVTRIFEGANDVLLSRLGLAWAVRRPAWPGGDDSALAASARDLWTTVLDHAEELANAHGVRIALRPLELHQLGSAAVVAQAAAAVADHAALAPELAAAFLDQARSQLLHLEPGSPVLDRRRHIALHLAEVTP